MELHVRSKQNSTSFCWQIAFPYPMSLCLAPSKGCPNYFNGWLTVWPEFPYRSFMVMAIWGLCKIRPHVLMNSALILSLGCLWAIKMQDLLRSGFIPFPVFSSFILFRMRMFFLLLWKKFDPLFLRCSRMGPIYPPKNNKTTCYWNIFEIWNIF